jgi:phage host-nuclease inhibitor protein Gam
MKTKTEDLTMFDILEEITAIKWRARALELSINGAPLSRDDRNALTLLASLVYERIDRLEDQIDKQQLRNNPELAGLACAESIG